MHALNTANVETIEGVSHAALLGVRNSWTSLAIWRRQLSPSIQKAAKAVCNGTLEHRSAFHPSDIVEIAHFREKLLDEAGANVSPITEDIVFLATAFAQISKAACVSVRLETVKGMGCRKFHLDNVPMRLIVTYAGLGTQWVSPAFAGTAHAQQERYAGPLNSMGTGDVAIFKGKKSDSANLILHRSPPQSLTGPGRLITVIDGMNDRNA